MANFWWRKEEGIIPVETYHTEKAWELWEDEIEATGAVSPFVTDYDPMFKIGAVRGTYFTPLLITVHSTKLKNNLPLVKQVVQALVNYLPHDSFDPKANVLVDWSSFEEYGDTSYELSQLLGSDVPPSNPDEFWEAGPADDWIASIHRRMGVAALQRRRRRRANMLRRFLK